MLDNVYVACEYVCVCLKIDKISGRINTGIITMVTLRESFYFY